MIHKPAVRLRAEKGHPRRSRLWFSFPLLTSLFLANHSCGEADEERAALGDDLGTTNQPSIFRLQAIGVDQVDRPIDVQTLPASQSRAVVVTQGASGPAPERLPAHGARRHMGQEQK